MCLISSIVGHRKSMSQNRPYKRQGGGVLIGYMRVSKADGSQVFDLQRDALLAAGVEPSRLYQDHASGKKDDRPGLEACLKSMREDDTLIVWKLDRLGRNLRHLVNTIHELMERKIGFRVLAGQGADIDTTTAGGRLVFGIFATLAEFERELIRERTIAGLSSARAQRRPAGQTPPGASRHGRARHQGRRPVQGIGRHAPDALS